MNLETIKRDKKNIWHPFTQQKTAAVPLEIEKASGAYVYTRNGKKLYDSIASWWVNLHGHCHPKIIEALHKQAQSFEQVIFAGATHEPAVHLAERVLGLLDGHMHRAFFSDNGSTSVEVALKMATQYWWNQGEKRNSFLAFQGAYHGDTLGAMSVGARSAFTAPFQNQLVQTIFFEPPLRKNPRGSSLAELERILEKEEKDIAAFIYEPLIQGAGGMRMQDKEELDTILKTLKEKGIPCIADEVMTGFGRTGKLFASDWLNNKPDIFCIAKGLTGGTLPLSMTLCHEDIYSAFHSKDPMKAFYHGHSFTANALGCAVAHASLDLTLSSDCIGRIESITDSHQNFCEELQSSSLTNYIEDIRSQGTILACELRSPKDSGYFSSIRNEVGPFFEKRGILARSLGNVLYCVPPYCSSKEDLKGFYSTLKNFITHVNKAET